MRPILATFVILAFATISVACPPSVPVSSNYSAPGPIYGACVQPPAIQVFAAPAPCQTQTYGANFAPAQVYAAPFYGATYGGAFFARTFFVHNIHHVNAGFRGGFFFRNRVGIRHH